MNRTNVSHFGTTINPTATIDSHCPTPSCIWFSKSLLASLSWSTLYGIISMIIVESKGDFPVLLFIYFSLCFFFLLLLSDQSKAMAVISHGFLKWNIFWARNKWILLEKEFSPKFNDAHIKSALFIYFDTIVRVTNTNDFDWILKGKGERRTSAENNNCSFSFPLQRY